MSWLSALSRWFAGSSRASSARVTLQAEHGRLSKELEETFHLFDERLQEVALRLRQLSDEQFEAESEPIQKFHERLRVAFRRLDTTMKEDSALERELAAWEDREDDGAWHADHPALRAELIRSELLLRRGGGAEQEGISNDEFLMTNGQSEPEELPELPLTSDERVNPLPSISPDQLMRAIREATHEAERWHAIPADDHDDDTLLQLHHVRDLNALLKQIDREQGIERDRIDLAVQPRAYR